MIKCLLPLLLVLTTPLLAEHASKTACQWDLSSCQEAALLYHEKMGQAESKVLLQEAKVQEAYTLYLPKLSLHADIMAAGKADCFYQEHKTAHLKASLQVPLYTFGKTHYYVASQKSALTADKEAKERTLQDVLYQTTKAYYQVFLADNTVSVLNEAISSLQEQTLVTESLVTAGLLQEKDFLSLEIQLAQREKEKMEADQALLLALKTLERLTSLPICTTQNLVEPASSLHFDKLCLQTLFKELVACHPDLLALCAHVEAAYYRYLAEKASRFPDIYAFSDYSTTSAYALPYTQGINVGVGIDMKLYEGGATSYRIEQRRREWELLVQQYEGAKKDLFLQIESAYFQLESAFCQLPIREKQVHLAEKSLSIASLEYRHGSLSSYEYLHQERVLTMAKAEYYLGLYQYFLQEAHLNYLRGISS